MSIAAAANSDANLTAIGAVERYHGLDALRASMMFLGLVLHSAINYTAEVAPYSPVQDRRIAYDMLVALIHLFRMPAFFLTAGFFGCYLFRRQGVNGILGNRTKRILIPLIVAWVLLAPVTRGGHAYRLTLDADVAVAAMTTWTGSINLMHLWFLYDLMLFYLLAAALITFAKVGKISLESSTDAVVRYLITGRFGIPLLIAATSVTLLPMSIAGMDTSASLLPPPRILIAYGVFFLFGWLLYNQRDLLEIVKRNGPGWLMAGFSISAVYLLPLVIPMPVADGLGRSTRVVIAAAATWYLVLGFTGSFIRFIPRQRSWIRYFADASYWLYILHFPLTVWIAGWLIPIPIPGDLKFLTVLIATTLVCIFTYDQFVRAGVIGVALNGRRYPRASTILFSHKVPTANSPW